MKRTILLTLLGAGVLARAATATISLSASPSAQTAAPGGTFNVTLSLSVTATSGNPTNVDGFDMYFVTLTGNRGLFSISAATGTGDFKSFGPTEPSGGDALNVDAATGFVRNGVDQGFLGPSPTAPPANYSLETVTFSIAPSTALGTYSFSTSTMANAGPAYYSDIFDSGGTVYPIDNAGTFSITVVPEPSTFGFLAVAASAGLAGYALRRRRARA